MKLKLDKENDAIYIRLSDSDIISSDEAGKGVILDFDEDDNVVGIEILNLSSRKNKIDLNSIQFDTA